MLSGPAGNSPQWKTENFAVPADPPPAAAFNYSPSSPSAEDPVSFDASASSDFDGSITSYLWSYGDGSSGSGVVATHAYASPGTYAVTLTVTDESGARGSSSQTIIVAGGGSTTTTTPGATAGKPPTTTTTVTQTQTNSQLSRAATLSVPKQRLSAVLAHGLVLWLSGAPAGRYAATVWTSGGAHHLMLGKAAGRSRRTGATRIVVRLSRAMAARLTKGASALKLVVSVQVTDAGGHSVRLRRVISLSLGRRQA
jgi:hypothetical protein